MPGHEIIGDIVAVGPGVRIFKIGQRVGGMWHGGHDGEWHSKDDVHTTTEKKEKKTKHNPIGRNLSRMQPW